MMRRSVVRGTGHYLPERVVENSYFESMLDTTDEWIRSRTGIERRHFAAEGEFTSDLAIAAGVPRSTGVRWVANLIAEGKLQAEADAADGRRTWVTLSPASRAALEKYLHEAARAGSRSLNNNRTDRV